MERRYPEYKSIYKIYAQIALSLASSYALYYCCPRNWSHGQRLMLSSGGICLTIYSLDILLDFIKHSRPK